MSKYQSKQKTVEAVQWVGQPIEDVVDLAASTVRRSLDSRDGSGGYLQAPNGNQPLRIGDYVVTSETGEKSVVSRAAFEAEFESAT